MATATDTQSKLNAGLRYGAASAGTIVTVLGGMSLISPDQAHDLIQQVQILNQSILTAYGALLHMGVILGPVAVIVAGYFGVKSVPDVKELASRLLRIAQNPATGSSKDATQALIAATIALPSVQTIVTDQKTADAAPSESVVAAEAVKIIPTK